MIPMLQELRDYWLPLMLFACSLVLAALLLALVIAMPLVAEYFEITQGLLFLFADDSVVRRSSIAGALGLIVTAWVFFRPNPSVLARKNSPKKPPGDTMAGA